MFSLTCLAQLIGLIKNLMANTEAGENRRISGQRKEHEVVSGMAGDGAEIWRELNLQRRGRDSCGRMETIRNRLIHAPRTSWEQV